MTSYLWVALGSALGGMLRYGFGRFTLGWDAGLPWTTIAINILGSFLIGLFGTFTLPGTRFAVPEGVRIFMMIGVCGGFTTFSSFSLESLDLLRTGHWGRAVLNMVLSVALCLSAVALGHYLGQRGNHASAIAVTSEEEFTG